MEVRMRWERNAERLAAKLAEKLSPIGILPVIKGASIVFDDSHSPTPLSSQSILTKIEEALRETGIPYSAITVEGDVIRIEDGEKEDVKEEKLEEKLFICPHCGYTTIHEELYWIHLKSHYFAV